MQAGRQANRQASKQAGIQAGRRIYLLIGGQTDIDSVQLFEKTALVLE